jgi:hypothetical protein
MRGDVMLITGTLEGQYKRKLKIWAGGYASEQVT